MYYLLGLLCSNFTPLWSVSIEMLGSYGNKAIEHIGHADFWSILNEKFQWIQQRNEIPPNEGIDDALISAYAQHEDEREYEVNEQAIDLIQYRINLFKVLNHFPNECENKTKILLPIIFDFFTEEYYDHLLALGLLGGSRSSYMIESSPKVSRRLSRKMSVRTLEAILNLLKQFHHPKQWLEPERLYAFYVRLLISADTQVQQLAYECLLNCLQMPQSIIQSDFSSHSNEIMPLFNPSTCRKTFHELIQGALLEPQVSESLKNQYAFLLIRILYSKLNEKRSLGSTTRGRKDYLELNRKYLFPFLITFASSQLYREHFVYFIRLLIEPFDDELFGHDESQWLTVFKKKIAFHVEEFNLSAYETFIKYLQHSLALLKTFVYKLGVYMHGHIDPVMKFYVLTIKLADYLSSQKVPEDNFNVKRLRVLLKRIRSMSYRGLQTIFELFDSDEKEVFKPSLIDSIWLCCVRENYLDDFFVRNKQREDTVHVLKLAIAWSRTSNLRLAVLGERTDAQDLVQYFIQLLNGSITDDNKQLVIEFVWNLMQLDREYQRTPLLMIRFPLSLSSSS